MLKLWILVCACMRARSSQDHYFVFQTLISAIYVWCICFVCACVCERARVNCHKHLTCVEAPEYWYTLFRNTKQKWNFKFLDRFLPFLRIRFISSGCFIPFIQIQRIFGRILDVSSSLLRLFAKRVTAIGWERASTCFNVCIHVYIAKTTPNNLLLCLVCGFSHWFSLLLLIHTLFHSFWMINQWHIRISAPVLSR